jgi:hypothetical protein
MGPPPRTGRHKLNAAFRTEERHKGHKENTKKTQSLCAIFVFFVPLW